METPIWDFVNRYAAEDPLRLHMPGHKGCGFLGMEHLDLTEVEGADSLYEASGIIQQSEENASGLFGCPTFYSTEGSSQCIRAMLYLALLDAKEKGKPPRIAAARNVHKTFLSGAALLDLEVDWLYPPSCGSYLSCPITPGTVADFLENAPQPPAAVYLTSPDYLGAVMDIRGIAQVCHRYDVLLLVDNAHGAYLRFWSRPGILWTWGQISAAIPPIRPSRFSLGELIFIPVRPGRTRPKGHWHSLAPPAPLT